MSQQASRSESQRQPPLLENHFVEVTEMIATGAIEAEARKEIHAVAKACLRFYRIPLTEHDQG